MAPKAQKKSKFVVVENYPTAGEIYRHSNGRTATVLYVANTARKFTRTPKKWPLHVVYIHMDGSVWTRPLKKFNEAFKLVKLSQRSSGIRRIV